MSNFIILNLSANIGKDEDESLYKSDLGNISGISTADAPIKYLLKYISEKYSSNEAIKIIAVATEAADKAYNNFEKVVINYAENINILKPDIIKVKGNTNEEIIANVIGKIQENDNVFIETTGGFRLSAYILMNIVRILEYRNINFVKAVYSNYNREYPEQNRIEDATANYQLFNLVNAVDKFTSYGNAESLEQYFELSEDKNIKQIIKAMKKFSDNITLCRTSELDKNINAISDCLDKLSNEEKKGGSEILFASLIDVIKKKFYISSNNMKIEIPGIVRWCMDNNLIQQGVTVYTELMPRYFYDKKLYTVDKNTFIEFNEMKSNFDVYYRCFYEGLLNSVKDNELSHFFDKYKEDERVKKALADSQDTDTFLKRVSFIKKDINDILKKEISEFFRLKRKIYDPSGDLYQLSAIHKNINGTSYESFFKDDNLPKKASGFVGKLFNNKKLVIVIATNYEEDKSAFEDTKLNMIESVSSGFDSDKFGLSNKIKKDEMQKILRDYIYIKNYLRNMFNHASEEHQTDDEMNEYFKAKGYETDENMTLENIKSLVYSALDTIENCK